MPGPRFRPCRQHQPMPLPPDVSDPIPANAMVRLVDAAVGRMDRRLPGSPCPGGGAPAHDPAMMPKVVLFRCAGGICSSRKIAAATRENINPMQPTGMEPLGHSTVNGFRTERARPIFEEVFAEVVAVLAEAGRIALETCFLDGAKVGADANRFSFTRRKPTLRHRDRPQHTQDVPGGPQGGPGAGGIAPPRPSSRMAAASQGTAVARPGEPGRATFTGPSSGNDF